MPLISYPSPRVAQLDAYILDLELIGLLKQQLSSIFENHASANWSFNLNPELWTLLLNLLVFRLTVWKSGTSYGLQLQNLKLSNMSSGKIISYRTRALLFGLLIGDYLYQKFELFLYKTDETENTGRRSIIGRVKAFVVKNKSVILTKTNDVVKIANLINFLLFLLNGNYPLITHRVLGISLTPIASELLKFTGNNVNFEFQNRQLVWNVMTEFLVFILPFLRLKAMRRAIGKITTSNNQNQRKLYSNLPELQCAVCVLNNRTNCNVTNPYVTNCGHTYCYVCVATLFNAKQNDGEDYCLKCGEQLKWFKEWEDVDPSAITVIYTAIEKSDEQISSDYESEDEEEEEEDYSSSGGGDSEEEESDYSEGEDYIDDEIM